jgi:hypothetical protein
MPGITSLKQNKHAACIFGVAVLRVFLVNASGVHKDVILHQLKVTFFCSLKNALGCNPSGGSSLEIKVNDEIAVGMGGEALALQRVASEQEAELTTIASAEERTGAGAAAAVFVSFEETEGVEAGNSSRFVGRTSNMFNEILSLSRKSFSRSTGQRPF